MMIKFSEFFDAFVNIVNETEMSWVDLEGDEDREVKIKELLKSASYYE